jgi:flavin reductase (DIM6/NTAB) family NADH-FMN oxidoreductase RutF
METFKEIKPEALDQSAFQLIGNDWMLVTAEAEGKINAMTASWGGLGVLWKKNVAYVVIRPQRYTKDLIDQAATFSLTFYEESFRKTLSYLGTVSGRDEDKIAKSGLTLRHLEGTPYFEEARVVMRCKKLYAQDLAPESFIDTQLMNEIYPTKDFHTLYIAEITQVFVKK